MGTGYMSSEWDRVELTFCLKHYELMTSFMYHCMEARIKTPQRVSILSKGPLYGCVEVSVERQGMIAQITIPEPLNSNAVKHAMSSAVITLDDALRCRLGEVPNVQQGR